MKTETRKKTGFQEVKKQLRGCRSEAYDHDRAMPGLEQEGEEVVGRGRYFIPPLVIPYNHLCLLLFREGKPFRLYVL